QPMPIIGYLYSGAPETSAYIVRAFRQGLNEAGLVEGQNVMIEYRWANNEPGRLPALAADLVRRRVAVIVTLGTSESVLAAKAATGTIPIVFRTGGDPVELGFVTSLSRPGGNITGVNALSLETVTKRLGLLHDLLPKAMHFAALLNPNDPNAGFYSKDLKTAALAIGRNVEVLDASDIRQIDAAFTSLAQKRPDALVVVSQGLFINRRVQIVTQAARLALPAMYPNREFAEIGGLISYGSNSTDQSRSA